MKKCNPYKIFPVNKGQLEKFPCSILALGLALMKVGRFPKNDLGVKVDDRGYCQLRNMDMAIRNHFSVVHYQYIRPEKRKKLGEYITFPGLYIVCVKGHYIFIQDKDYYSFFNNLDDEVVAYWKLEE